MRTFQYSDARSHKFWTIDVQGNTFTVTYGKVGTAGQTQTKAFPTPEKAAAEADKLIREKTGKGYTETTPAGATSDREALEQAIRADPADAAAHAAYADLLIEQGDPRGEFIRVQLALEDESLPRAERQKLREREQALLKKHRAEWVGDWADRDDAKLSTDEWSAPKGWVPYRFTRGLLTRVEVGTLTAGMARALIAAPQLAFVRELVVRDFDYGEPDDFPDEDDDSPEAEAARQAERDFDEFGDHPGQQILLKWPRLRQLRVFRLGGADPAEYDDRAPYRCHTPGNHVYDFAKQMPDVEKLWFMAHVRDAKKLCGLAMPRLREFGLYHGWSYPLDVLARNPSLTNLERLYCHPHAIEHTDQPYIRLPGLRAVCRSPHLTKLTHLQLRMSDVGDAGAEEVVKSGILKRLKVLDLRHGCVTDKGAKALAACPDLKHLESLDLGWNAIGPEGQAALRATGVQVELNRQHGPTDDYRDYLSHGDIE